MLVGFLHTVFVCDFWRTDPSLWLVRFFLSWTAFDARKKNRGVRNGSGWVVWNVADYCGPRQLAYIAHAYGSFRYG